MAGETIPNQSETHVVQKQDVFEEFNPKKEEDKTKKVEFTIHDVRFLIESLPEPLKSINYERLTAIITDASIYEQESRIKVNDL